MSASVAWNVNWTASMHDITVFTGSVSRDAKNMVVSGVTKFGELAF